MHDFLVTVDVESDWGGRLSPVKENLEGLYQGLGDLLYLFEKLAIPATFFISSDLIKEATRELQKIKTLQHEVASHGHKHIDYSELSNNQYKYQLEQSIDKLETLYNQKVDGFRAPQFRINKYHFEVLSKLNLKYDSSIVSGKSIFGRYDNKKYVYPYYHNSILEIPVTSYTNMNIPFGLLWVNLLGIKITNLKIKNKNILVLYLHLFDLLNNKKYDSRFEFKVNFGYIFKQNKVFQTLENLLKYYLDKNYNFKTMSALASSYELNLD